MSQQSQIIPSQTKVNNKDESYFSAKRNTLLSLVSVQRLFIAREDGIEIVIFVVVYDKIKIPYFSGILSKPAMEEKHFEIRTS